MKREYKASAQLPTTRGLRQPSEAQILSAADAAARRYSRHPNVLGVAAGTKYKKRRPQKELCVQFFVREKRKEPKSRPLPKFVYSMKDGQIDRSVKICTDVIKVRKVHLGGGAGSRLKALGSTGSITLFFRNRAENSESAYYVLTCSHVVGNLTRSPPVDDEIDCPDCNKTSPFGLVVKNTTARGEFLEYDIALARLTDDAVEALGPDMLRKLDGKVDGEAIVLTDVMKTSEIRPPLRVDCQLARSGSRRGNVRSFAGTFVVELRGRKLQVRNLFGLDVAVAPGDSGGIVYSEERAVGLMVAHSPEGWAWFQSLQGAIDHLGTVDPQLTLQCF